MSLAEEFKRKSIHLVSSAIPFAYALWLSKWVAVGVLAATSVAMLIVESFRHRDNWAGRTFRRLFGPMLREKEKAPTDGGSPLDPSNWLGATPYCMASLLAVALFPKPVAVLSLLYLAVGDTAASLVGKTWGRTRIGGKSAEGSAAFVVSTALVALAARALSPDYALVPALAASVTAMLAELLLPRIDDNFSIPLTAGATMFAVAWIV